MTEPIPETSITTENVPAPLEQWQLKRLTRLANKKSAEKVVFEKTKAKRKIKNKMAKISRARNRTKK